MTGLIFAKYRAMNPSTGQWISEDPLGFTAGDPNVRRYVGNNGENARDGSGLYLWIDRNQDVDGFIEFLRKNGIGASWIDPKGNKEFYIWVSPDDRQKFHDLWEKYYGKEIADEITNAEFNRDSQNGPQLAMSGNPDVSIYYKRKDNAIGSYREGPRVERYFADLDNVKLPDKDKSPAEWKEYFDVHNYLPGVWKVSLCVNEWSHTYIKFEGDNEANRGETHTLTVNSSNCTIMGCNMEHTSSSPVGKIGIDWDGKDLNAPCRLVSKVSYIVVNPRIDVERVFPYTWYPFACGYFVRDWFADITGKSFWKCRIPLPSDIGGLHSSLVTVIDYWNPFGDSEY